MSHSKVQITAASRLHFGLFSFGRRTADEREFGGVGMMIDEPGLRLTVEPAEHFIATGPLAHRVEKFAKRWSAAHDQEELPDCKIHVVKAPPEHAGLGMGTQLGLSVAAGLNAFFDRPVASPQELAELTARGARSAIGVYGFTQGGLIVENGKLPGETLSPLLHRVAVPEDWRVVLVRPPTSAGLSGPAERSAFRELPPVENTVSNSLRREVTERMLPAIKAADFNCFSESVYNFGRAAGECFAPVQGGCYNGPVLTEIVREVRRLGVVGVGQSSWGPTIYCFLPDEGTACDFSAKLRNALPEDVDICITRPCNRGAMLH